MTVTANRPTSTSTRNRTTWTTRPAPRRPVVTPLASPATGKSLPGDLKLGHTYFLGEAAGVPHKFRPIFLRLASVEIGGSTPGGMVWVTGHEVNPKTGRLGEFRNVPAILAGILSPTHPGADRARRGGISPVVI